MWTPHRHPRQTKDAKPMQCHRCPKSVQNGGTPDEECLSCKGADILDNDHVTVSPTDDVGKVMRYAEPTASQGSDHSLETHLDSADGNTTRNIDDCLSVVDVLKRCHQSSLPHIAKIVAVLIAAGSGFGMAVSMLNGETLSEYARSSGTSRQAAQQRWSRIVSNAPQLSAVPKSRSLNGGRRRRGGVPSGGGSDGRGKTPSAPPPAASDRKKRPSA